MKTKINEYGINTENKGLTFPPDTRVQQKYKDESNVNKIVQKFAHGQMPLGNNNDPIFMDISEIPDYQDMLNHVAHTNNEFAKLPSKLRAHFENEPSKMIAWLKDPENLTMARKFGLINPEEKEVTPLDTEIERQTLKNKAKEKIASSTPQDTAKTDK